MYNILFVMYYDFSTSSAIHVHTFANALQLQGNDCVVAVPINKESVNRFIGGDYFYRPAQYKETLHNSFVFSNEKGPDIIHAWTPRENVRKQCTFLKEKFPACKLIVHLEDNEEVVLETMLGLSNQFLASLPNSILGDITPDLLSHFNYYKTFLNEADGITVIVDTLTEFVPKDKPHFMLWPIVGFQKYYPRKINHGVRAKLGFDPDDFVICYAGSVHSVNYREVRSLYLAVALANREGISVKLLRTGRDEYAFLGKNDTWARKYAIELGYVDREKIPTYLSIADFLIQPGRDDRFNAYRLPSKIPEFLAMGKPVAVPHSNIGRFLKDREEAIILEKGDSLDILSAIKLIKGNKELCNRMCEGARNFALKHFDKETVTNHLLKFYSQIIGSN